MSPQIEKPVDEPIDGKTLDEYLEGGSVVSQRYRELAVAGVPDELDRQVLARARAAVANRSAKPRSWGRWSAPLALAATLTLVVSIVIDSGVQQGVEPVPARQLEESIVRHAAPAAESTDERQSASGPAAAPAEESAPAVVQQQTQAAPPPSAPELAAQRKAASRRTFESKTENAATAEAQRQRADGYEQASAVDAEPVARAGAAAPPDSALTASAQQIATTANAFPLPASASARQVVKTDFTMLQEAVVTAERRRAEDAQGAGPRSPVPVHMQTSAQADAVTKEADVGSMQAAPRELPDPDEWLADIRELRKDGYTKDADREWERFRAAFPQYHVADDDVARARSNLDKK